MYYTNSRKGPTHTIIKKDAIQSERIQFLGKIPDEEIKIYMHSASIFAFPSITKMKHSALF